MCHVLLKKLNYKKDSTHKNVFTVIIFFNRVQDLFRHYSSLWIHFLRIKKLLP